jgi:hypothetical protein
MCKTSNCAWMFSFKEMVRDEILATSTILKKIGPGAVLVSIAWRKPCEAPKKLDRKLALAPSTVALLKLAVSRSPRKMVPGGNET